MKTSSWIKVLLMVSAFPCFAQATGLSIFDAARSGTVEEVKAAVAAGGSLTAVQSSDGLTALHFAVRYNAPEVAQVLIDAGSSLTKRDAAGMSVLFNALEFNQDLKMAKLLIQKGVPLVDRDSFGGTALIRAVINPNPEIFRFVLAQKGVKVSEKDYDGVSVLAWALQYASLDVIQELLRAGAQVNVSDSRGYTPLMVAAGVDVGGAKVKLLLKAGARLEDRAAQGTAFLLAAGNPDLAVVQALVAAGAKMSVRDDGGASALMVAALFNTNAAMISYLLGLGVPLNDVDRENKTALNWAPGNRNPEVAAALVKAGAVATPAALITTPREVSPLPQGTWVVLSNGTLATWQNEAWAARPGTASAVAQRGGQVWSLGLEAVDGDYPLRRWNGSAWEVAGVAGKRLAVGPDGQPWLVTSGGEIRHLVKGMWSVVPGSAHDIGVGSDGTVWIIGTTAVGENFEILKLSAGKWAKIDGAAVHVAVDPQGNPWVINAGHKVFARVKGKWTAIDLWGAKAIGIGSEGTVYLALNENGLEPSVNVLSEKVLFTSAANSLALP